MFKRVSLIVAAAALGLTACGEQQAQLSLGADPSDAAGSEFAAFTGFRPPETGTPMPALPASSVSQALQRWPSVTDRAVNDTFRVDWNERTGRVRDFLGSRVASRVLPEDATTSAVFMHMASPRATDSSIAFVKEMARIGEVEGFSVVVRTRESNIIEGYLGEVADAVHVIDYPGTTDVWTEDQGDIREDRTVGYPTLTTEGGYGRGDAARAALDQGRRERLTRHGLSPSFARQGAVTDRTGQRNPVALALSAGVSTDETFTYLEGGNVLTGTLADGRGYALVGKDSVAMAQAILGYDSGRQVSWDEATKAIANDLGIDGELLFPIEQPGDFHIDMYVGLAPGGHVILNSEAMAKAVRANGFPANGEPLDESAYAPNGYEALILADLANTGLTVHRVPGVFGTTGNFMNAERGQGPDGVPFSIMLGGTPEAEEWFRAYLPRVYGTGHRAYFLDRSLTRETLEASGGISCRVKVEGSAK